jgi:uncharacterized phage protein gp47/JayE
MPTFSFTDLVKPLTRTEAQASFYAAYAALGLKVSSWKPGAVPRTFTWAGSIIVAALSELQAAIARSGFLDLAEGPWLDALAWHVYRQKRNEATFATGVVILDNGGAGEFGLDPGDLIVSNPVTNKQYRNATAIVIAPLATGVPVPVRAVEAGALSSAPAGAITDLVTTLLQVTCTNPQALIGTDAETDAALRSRCRESLGALSPFGPWDAYASAVRNAKRADGSSLGITRIRPVKDGYGNVVVRVATNSGGVAGGAEDLESDLGIAHEAVQRRAVPYGVSATVVSAQTLSIAVTCELWMYNTSGRTDAEIASAVQARLSAFMQRQPIGGNRVDLDEITGVVYRDAIVAEITAAFPNQTFHVAVTTPAGDVVVDPDEVPTLGLVTPTIHQIEAGKGLSA